MEFPNGKRFAFTIVDDTDNSFLENTRPVYELLRELGFRTTKSVWVYPPRDCFTGLSLEDPEYLAFLRDLRDSGFEIALHGVGSGAFVRQEILDGLKRFRAVFGDYPTMHINHSSNPDNLYWAAKRFSPPVRWLYGRFMAMTCQGGEDPSSPFFWGDVAKERIKYVRNLTFNGINTLRYDPLMPYRVESKSKFANYWFSSSDGHTVEEFADLISERNIDRLATEAGVCIVYTHFASGFVAQGRVDHRVEERLRHIASRGDGWFAPASEVLDYLLEKKRVDRCPGRGYLMALELRWLAERMVKRLRRGR